MRLDLVRLDSVSEAGVGACGYRFSGRERLWLAVARLVGELIT